MMPGFGDQDTWPPISGDPHDPRVESVDVPDCPDDCTHREGRHCRLGHGGCVRSGDDYYMPRQLEE